MKKWNNGAFRLADIGKEVDLYGWLQRKRNLGGLLFLDLRDRSGVVQLVIRPEQACYQEASSFKNESVLSVRGTVVERENKNAHLPTGDIEIAVDSIECLNSAKDLPFEVDDHTTALEDTRLKYRYLDIR